MSSSGSNNAEADRAAIDEFREKVVKYVLGLLEGNAIETYTSHRDLVEEIMGLHEYTHPYAESFPQLRWFTTACHELSTAMFLAVCGVYYEACFALRHGVELVNKNTKGAVLSDFTIELYDQAYGRLSDIFHGNKEVKGLDEFRDYALAVTYLYVELLTSWNPSLRSMLLHRPDMEEDLAGIHPFQERLEEIVEKWRMTATG